MAPRTDLAAWQTLADAIGTALEAVAPEAGDAFVEAVATFAAPLVDDGAIDEATVRTVTALSAHAAEAERAGRAARRRVAVHEAGHAVAALALGHRVLSVTMQPDLCEQSNGLAVYAITHHQLGAGHWEDSAVAQYAGNAASQLAGYAFDPSPYSSDFEGAALAARRAQQGLSEPEEKALLRFYAVRATELLRRHWSAVEAVAAALIDRGTLSGDEVETLFAEAMSTARNTSTSTEAA